MFHKDSLLSFTLPKTQGNLFGIFTVKTCEFLVVKTMKIWDPPRLWHPALCLKVLHIQPPAVHQNYHSTSLYLLTPLAVSASGKQNLAVTLWIHQSVWISEDWFVLMISKVFDFQLVQDKKFNFLFL